MVASVTLTKRNGHSTRNLESNLKGTLTSESKWNLKMSNVKGIVRPTLTKNTNIDM